MKAGFGKADITPPVGTRFGCFATERRLPVVGHHDPLWARTVAVSQGTATVALVSCDLAVNMSWVVREARARIERRTGLPGPQVIISHTHVHSAPGGVGVEAAAPGIDPDFFGEPDYVERVVEATARSVEEALGDREECLLLATRQPIEGIGTTRDRRDLPYQPYAGLLEFIRCDGTVKGAVVSYACHPSILGWQNLLTSSDFVGVACDVLGAALGGAQVVLLMGAAGDVSTRSTRREQTYAEVDRLGRALVEQLLAIQDNLEPVEVDRVCSLSTIIDVPVGPLPTGDELQAAVNKQRAVLDRTIREAPDAASGNPTYNMVMGAVMEQYVYWERACRQLETVRSVKVATTPSEVQIIRVGPIYFLGVEGELHTAREAEIRDRVAPPYLLIVAPANGTLGNIPGRSERQGILAAAAGDRIVEESVSLVRRALATEPGDGAC